MARSRPTTVIRKSGPASGRSAADIRREMIAAQNQYQGQDNLPGGNLGNGDVVMTTNGPVWVPHGAPKPANAVEMRAGADDNPGGRVSDLGQPQTNPTTNLYNYRENGSQPGYGNSPPMPADFDFPGTWDPNPAPMPIIGGYNGMPGGGAGGGGGGGAGGPGTGTNGPNTGTFGGGNGANPDGTGGNGGDPSQPPPNNPFDPTRGPPAALAGPQPGGHNVNGLLAAYGYTTGPNGELLPIHLRQGMSPFQNQPGQSQQPGYTVPGWDTAQSQGGELKQQQGGDGGGMAGHMMILGYDAQGRPVDGARLAREPGLQYTPTPNNPFDPSKPGPFPINPGAPPYMGGPPMGGGRLPGGG